jgi:hypothetical protein
MSLFRVLAIALLFCPLFGSAQESQVGQASSPTTANPKAASSDSLDAPNFSPKSSTEVKPPLDALSQESSHQILNELNKDNYHILPPATKPQENLRVNTENGLWPDSTCYTMRSYVVARDDRGSDSTHPVSYSTCQPGSRYGLKTTETKQDSPSR